MNSALTLKSEKSLNRNTGSFLSQKLSHILANNTLGSNDEGYRLSVIYSVSLQRLLQNR